MEDIKVIGITIPSIEECDAIPYGLMKYDGWWWLRSPGNDSNDAACVDYDGSVNNYGNFVDSRRGYVRPALILNESQNLPIGCRFEKYGKTWQVVAKNYAFCCGDIGQRCFRKDWNAIDANQWEKSDLKKYVEDWWMQRVFMKDEERK